MISVPTSFVIWPFASSFLNCQASVDVDEKIIKKLQSGLFVFTFSLRFTSIRFLAAAPRCSQLKLKSKRSNSRRLGPTNSTSTASLTYTDTSNGTYHKALTY